MKRDERFPVRKWDFYLFNPNDDVAQLPLKDKEKKDLKENEKTPLLKK